MKIECGWCGRTTAPDRCACGRDPAVPWVQRGLEAPVIRIDAAGRPVLDEKDIRQRYEAARGRLHELGRAPTIEALAEILDRSPRTVRQWRQRYALE